MGVGPGGFCIVRAWARSLASLGPWEQGSGQFLGSERPEDLNATWPLLRTLTTGPHSQNGDHAARGGAKASAQADWKAKYPVETRYPVES